MYGNDINLEESFDALNMDVKAKVKVPNIPPIAFKNPTDYEAASMDFAVRYLKVMMDLSPETSFVTSPCAIQLTMGMLAMGSELSTKKELLSCIFPETHQVESYLRRLHKITQEMDSFDTATRILSSFRAEFRGEYKGRIKAIYRGQQNNHRWSLSDRYDFETIDRFPPDVTALQTEKLLDKVMDIHVQSDPLANFGFINENTRLLLTQAFVYKTYWNQTFDVANNFRGNFYKPNTAEPVLVEYMRQNGKLRYFETEDWKCLRKSTPDSNVAMYFLMPTQPRRLVAAEFPGEFIILWKILHRCSLSNVMVQLPKFRLHKSWHDITDSMKTLGLSKSFLPFDANFCRMVCVYDFEKGYSITKCVQKCDFEFDEGFDDDEEEDEENPQTESSKETSKSIDQNATSKSIDQNATSKSIDQKATTETEKSFIADHPFIYFLVAEDNSKNMYILLAGRYSGPQ